MTICHVVQCKYKVEMKTGDKKYAGTDDKIIIQLSEDGDLVTLDNKGHDDFEREKYVNI